MEPQVSVPSAKVAAGAAHRGVGEAVAQPAREFDHRALAEQHRARLAQARDHGGVEVERLLLERCCAPGGAQAGRRQEVLGSPRDAVQRAAPAAELEVALGQARLHERDVAGHRLERVQGWGEALDALEVRLGEFDR
jgi:hypothetical protein